mmetsp:Transcript_46121/g.76233  ORF Transcript_46121/g.76233 Transcript_46121/m.76233 type:complete len:207 (-) Transcript_46121:303-923(-)|eukprot:CAMPEP_0119340362 /NCGR_PEP_ID=MMETSP1333-20130426/100191_1 /TAXON_ID=418940 /ORGANISM="Scyphosphaera apsteinii, Strain RCC1455" /LENGTH=206 /DNA_ID=CAMNT_0007352099 /DNA_START=171 /DNA_END=791 /DNA_ORIENTATION=-
MEMKFPTELHKACHEQKPDEVQSMLAAGIDFKAVDVLEQTALIFTVRNVVKTEEAADKVAEITAMLIKAGADVNTADKYGDPPLILAIMDGGGVSKHKTVKALVEGGACVFQCCENFKMTPLHWSAVAGDLECAKVLVDAGCRKNKIDRLRETPLQTAKKHLQRLEQDLDAFGYPHTGEAKEQVPIRIKKYKAFIAYIEGLPGVRL